MEESFPRNHLDKPGYIVTFHDDFNDVELDRAKWLPYYLPQWSSRKNSCASYRIQDSELILQIKADQQPWCPEFNGGVKVSNLQTGVFSGPLGSKQGQHNFSGECRVREEQATEQLFIQQYGYFEIRAKGLSNPNNVCALWMIGFEDQPDRSAEICPFELKGWNVAEDRCLIGFGIHPFGDPTIQDEFFEKPFSIDPTQFHLYAVDWTENGVEFYLDNQLIHSSKQSPQYPMQLMLNLYEIPPQESGSTAKPEYPTEFVIDYIRCYQRV
ncbi:glycoside hydrolase family 16 protein [Paenibacillus hexagrammi]|uniref:Glycoside hydrolase family 16 protein n=1 Tax=Paenibacillus hexagrammi TaxID=2908839 RepID=A0ABY3SG40_9BACL|nr:glycoside hydrolase family 16 protein [Paenibacillus sp. YPD9-1]UJF32999.1 glycoside hydrolase family 16 protein [Paenibacillus sp. YPD9-1]